jgi:hypothetical protein
VRDEIPLAVAIATGVTDTTNLNENLQEEITINSSKKFCSSVLPLATHPDPENPMIGYAREMDPQFVDLGLLEEWLLLCDKNHLATCHQPIWACHISQVFA